MPQRIPDGMSVEYFLKEHGDDPDFSQEPYIYCCRQEPQIPSSYYYRCGAAGLQLFADADRPYGSSDTSRRGLSGRMTQYIGHIRPNNFKIFAAIRIKKQIVALPQHRIGGDEQSGDIYNIDRGNMSAVRAAEMTFHHYLDSQKPNIKRFAPHPESELFQPGSGSVEQLLVQMRKVQGIEMFLFDTRTYRYDKDYKGGIAPPAVLQTRDTTQRRTQNRTAREPTVTVRMSKSGVEQLRSEKGPTFNRLMTLMREQFRISQGTEETITVKLSRAGVDELLDDEDDGPRIKRLIQIYDSVVAARRAQELLQAPARPVPAAAPAAAAPARPPPPPVRPPLPPPVPRVTRLQARNAVAPRRSGRIAAQPVRI